MEQKLLQKAFSSIGPTSGIAIVMVKPKLIRARAMFMASLLRRLLSRTRLAASHSPLSQDSSAVLEEVALLRRGRDF